MGKHARKRQKTSQSQLDSAPGKAARLEMLLDEESKDDEERRLESLLFGVKYVPKGKGKGRETLDMTNDEDGDDSMVDLDEGGGGRGLQHLLDQDLFFVDGGDDSQNFVSPDFEGPQGTPQSDSGSQSPSESDSDESGSESDTGSSSSRPPRTLLSKSLPKSLTKARRKPPAWTDPADIEKTAHISLLSGPKRLRKLRQGLEEDEITGRDYETRLRTQFERINPEPAWAKKARSGKRRSKKEGAEDSEPDSADEEGLGELLSSSNGILAGKHRKGPVVLPQGAIAIERVRDANHSVQDSGSGEVRVLTFHPKPSVPVLCVATADRRVRLFSIDGHLSPLLSTLHLPSLPLISSSSVQFHPQGNTLLFSGPRPFFYTYDLQSGTSTFHRRGLWGSGSEFDHSSILSASTNNPRRRKRGTETSGSGGKGGGGNTEIMLHTAFSPNTGSLLAVAGRGGNVHLVDWKSGAGQVIGSLKISSGGGIQGLWWVPPSSDSAQALGDEGVGYGSGPDGHLAVMTGEAEVYIWDVGQRRCVKRWKDEGGYRGAGRVLAGGGGRDGWMAIGSTSGFVNVYGSDSFSVPSNNEVSVSASLKPTLVKTLGHLTTPISTLKFNHDAQLLAMASKDKKDAMRLIHLPSLTSFANWPTSSTPLGHVTAIDFSAQSEYVAVGNTRGKVLLYHLRDYGAPRVPYVL